MSAERSSLDRPHDTVMLAADPGLDRASAIRDDASRLDTLIRDARSRVLIVEGGDPLVAVATGSLWFEPDILALGASDGPPVFLGVDRVTGGGRFAANLPTRIDARDAAREPIAKYWPLMPIAPLRALMTSGALPAGELAAASLARSLFGWHQSTRFCGWCGSGMSVAAAGWKASCTACGREQYPRVDPVAIMLITDGERCVLAHEPRFPDKMYSCIAGYIEPGEDVAHAVRRETFEELGLAVGTVEIVDSQPWPFPHSLMIGCIASVERGSALKIDPVEIEDARWFTRAETRQLIARSHPDGLWEPGVQAIAHRLIGCFAAGHATPVSLARPAPEPRVG
ncbi:MAG: NAD(+) diphosphatase [Hyphomicrobiaceae bacterium]|nr:NAD(+) diphosphatase [Hyphomicrobiaceae bacterium]